MQRKKKHNGENDKWQGLLPVLLHQKIRVQKKQRRKIKTTKIERNAYYDVCKHVLKKLWKLTYKESNEDDARVDVQRE